MQSDPKARDLAFREIMDSRPSARMRSFRGNEQCQKRLTKNCSIIIVRFTRQHLEEEEALSEQTTDDL